MQIFTTKYLAIGITVLLVSLVFSQRNTHASDYPIFRDGKLIIPRVDTDAQPGSFQNAEFQFEASTNSWKLNQFVETKITSGPVTSDEKVEAVIVDSSPVQV